MNISLGPPARQANTALMDKESIVKIEAEAGDAAASGPRAMVEDEVSVAVPKLS